MSFFRFVSKCLSFYPYSWNKLIDQKLNYFYSCWMSNFFKYVGEGTRFERFISKRGSNITIGANCYFHKGVSINAWEKYRSEEFSPSIIIGDNCNFGRFTHITASHRIIIGDNLLTGAFVIISDNNHGSLSVDDLKKRPCDRGLVTKGEIVIGKNVWLGDKVTVLSGVHIGDGTVVAANAVVTKDAPPYSLVAGVPAKVIKIFINNE